MSQDHSTPRDQAASQLLQFDPRVIDALADRLGVVVVQRVLDAIRAEGLVSEANEPQAWLDATAIGRPQNQPANPRERARSPAA